MMKAFFSFFNKQKRFADGIVNGDIEYSSYYKDSFKRFRKNKAAMTCLAIILLLIAVAIFAPLIAPYDPSHQDYQSVLAQPNAKHLLGADEYGRDILSRIIYGTRISLSIGILAQLLASIIGITLGSLAGYFGGIVDAVISASWKYFPRFRISSSLWRL